MFLKNLLFKCIISHGFILYMFAFKLYCPFACECLFLHCIKLNVVICSGLEVDYVG